MSTHELAPWYAVESRVRRTINRVRAEPKSPLTIARIAGGDVPIVGADSMYWQI